MLIVGASRGIGKGFVYKYLAEGWSVHATARNESDLASFPDGVQGYLCDVSNNEQIVELASSLNGSAIDLLIHNAGVGRGTPDDVMTAINVEAPFKIIEALLPHVAISTQKKIAIMSSQLGSRERFGNGETPSNSYGRSKCLLNDRFRELEPGWRELGVSSLVVHPGWVKTDMGGDSADITVEQSVDGMYDVFDKMSAENTGHFVTYAGTDFPW